MDDSFLMGGGETAANLFRVLDCLARRQRSFCQTLSESLTLEQFRDDERRILVSADVEDRQDVRMIQCARRARFLFKSTEAIRIQIDRRQALNRHITCERGVVSAINLAHSTRPDERANLVPSELCPDRNVHEDANLARL